MSTAEDCKVNSKTCQDPVQDIEIESKLAYPRYNQAAKINDIALLRLKTPADVLKNNVRTICLPMSEENQVEAMNSEQQFTIAGNELAFWSHPWLLQSNFHTGWGMTEAQKTSKVMKKGYISKMEKSDCEAKLGENIPVYPTYICAGGVVKLDACYGDSGKFWYGVNTNCV